MNTGLYLQVSGEKFTWEEVDIYTWENWQHALDQKGNPRYNGNRIDASKPAVVVASLAGISRDELAVAMRFLGVRESQTPVSFTGGFVRRPEFIRFRKGKKETIHEVHGESFVRRTRVTEEVK